MAENIAKYSRLITDRWKDGGDKREGKGKKRFDHGNYVKLRGKETYRSFWGGKKRSILVCIYVCVCVCVEKRQSHHDPSSRFPRLL